MIDDQLGLFSNDNTTKPLAHRVRPTSIEQFKGQGGLKAKISTLNLENLPHIVFFGPPGCGKTTIAGILAHKAKAQLFEFNAVLAGVVELRKLIKEAINTKHQQATQCIIFIDEIHRFNKAQQDALLPHLERGDFVLFGATTENPNTSLNQAILSRIQKWRLAPLKKDDLIEIVEQVITTQSLEISDYVVNRIVDNANGDARSALNQVETLLNNRSKIKDLPDNKVLELILFDNRRYDKNSERHYDVISAFIKSVRGSDVDAAILWLAVMLDGGEDIEFIARRLIILASEDIGNADPRGLQIATSAHYAIKTIGMPEARIILAQATTYLAKAPKSNASYLAINKALEFVKSSPTIEVPTHLRNHHPDKSNYKYPHSYPNHWTEQIYQNTGEVFFDSSQIGYEKMQDDYQEKIKK